MRRIPRDVSVQLFRRDENGVMFLLLRRIAARGGFWQGITGAPLPGETDEQAAVREVREETGWDVAASLESLDLTYSYSLGGDRRARWDLVYGPGVTSIDVVSFAAEAPADVDPILDPGEHDRFDWFAFEEAESLLAWPVEEDALPSRRAALRALMERLE